MKKAFLLLCWTLALLASAGASSARVSLSISTNESTVLGSRPSLRMSGWSPRWNSAVVAWWDSDLGITLNGSTVSAWASQSGGRNTTQGAAASQPTYTASSSSYGKHALLSFATASSQNLVDTAAITLAQPDTFYVVGRSTSGAGNYAFVDASAGTIQACYSASGGQTAAMYAGTILPSSTAVSSPAVMAFAFNGASSAIYVKNFDSNVASGAANTNAMGTIAIGGANRGASFLQGEIAALIVSNALDDVFFRGRMFTYLGNRYQVPAE